MLKDDSSTGGQADSRGEQGEYPMSTRYPGRHDLLLGRGGETNNHSGNIKFRRLLEEYREAYQAAPKGTKPEVSKKLVRQWRNLDPPGRFLAKSDSGDLWEDVGDEAAWRRASKSLGERSKRPHQSVGGLKGSSAFNPDVSAAALDNSGHGVKRRRDELIMTGSPSSDRTGFLAQNLGTAPSESMSGPTYAPQMPWPMGLPPHGSINTMQQRLQAGSDLGNTSWPSSTSNTNPSGAATGASSELHQQQYQRMHDQASITARQMDSHQLAGRSMQLGSVFDQSTGGSNPTLLMHHQPQQQSGAQLQLQAHHHQEQQVQQQQQGQQPPNDNQIHLPIGLQPQERADLPTAADLLAGNVFTSDSNSTADEHKASPQDEDSSNQH